MMARADFSLVPALEAWLSHVRAMEGVREKTMGVFYWGRIPLLHFHVKPDEAVADLKVLSPALRGWERFDVSSSSGRTVLLRALRGRIAVLSDKPPRRTARRHT
ncbi:MAG: hypothetical protein JNJ55_10920 [Betaproteobacteria bacterium]|nr:hypothetical protein [Betaproteobacteria bacterium]